MQKIIQFCNIMLQNFKNKKILRRGVTNERKQNARQIF